MHYEPSKGEDPHMRELWERGRSKSTNSLAQQHKSAIATYDRWRAAAFNANDERLLDTADRSLPPFWPSIRSPQHACAASSLVLAKSVYERTVAKNPAGCVTSKPLEQHRNGLRNPISAAWEMLAVSQPSLVEGRQKPDLAEREEVKAICERVWNRNKEASQHGELGVGGDLT